MFYLAFENAICNYYVTEKFWQMKRLIVPIVLSRRSLRGLGVPDDAYIAVEDFSSPKALAQHLKWLQNNRDEYLKYFAWTKNYKRSSGSNPLCDLCQLAVDGQRTQIPNIVDWWETDGQCEHGETRNPSIIVFEETNIRTPGSPKIPNGRILQAFVIMAAFGEILLHIAVSWQIVSITGCSNTLGLWAIRCFDFTLICPVLFLIGIAYKKRALFIPYVLYKMFVIALVCLFFLPSMSMCTKDDKCFVFGIGAILVLAWQMITLYAVFCLKVQLDSTRHANLMNHAAATPQRNKHKMLELTLSLIRNFMRPEDLI
ncbi:glycosyltransferase family 10 (fucosyltransferase) c-term domain-containing protein [Ditylenchus destructor]|nr:glycosyltransferase family 10 (fucosyltransferase) c-term domain-containing protein [Ditylenchus destructor]